MFAAIWSFWSFSPHLLGNAYYNLGLALTVNMCCLNNNACLLFGFGPCFFCVRLRHLPMTGTPSVHLFRAFVRCVHRISRHFLPICHSPGHLEWAAVAIVYRRSNRRNGHLSLRCQCVCALIVVYSIIKSRSFSLCLCVVYRSFCVEMRSLLGAVVVAFGCFCYSYYIVRRAMQLATIEAHVNG